MPARLTYGCLADKSDDGRDRHFRPMAIHLPAAVDLRPHCPPVMDQGNLGACTAHGITGALRYLLIKAGKTDVALSRLQLYYDERAREKTIGQDAGAEIRDGINRAVKIGVGREFLWPYDEKKFKVKPPAEVYADALSFRALEYERCAISVTPIKTALALGFPVVVGVTLFESFEGDDVAKTGIVPMPARKEQEVGGHCLYCVGYGQKPGTFTVRNSWADDWGDHGDCYFPEAYLGSPAFGSDYWVIRSDRAA